MAGHWKKALAASALLCAASLHAGSLDWQLSSPGTFDYGRQLTLPVGFGNGDFTLELWIRPNNSASFPVGSTNAGPGQLTNWSNANVPPYSSPDWWFHGNFLLDGHNNSNFGNGTFSLQFYDGGRIRWLFGDGASNLPTGQLWSVPNSTGDNGPRLLDGLWHHVALVRRLSAGTQSTLELWIDGSLIDFETSNVYTPMYTTFWDDFNGFPQQGWYWGSEKQAAIGVLSQWEDYKGLIDELRFWTRAKLSNELSDPQFRAPVTGTEANLAGWYDFNEGSGTDTCSSIVTTQCMDLFNAANVWNAAEAPTTGGGGDMTAPSVPQNLSATPASPTTVNLTWNASTDNAGGTGVASYRVQRGGVTIPGAGAVAGTSYSDAGLTQNTTYSYTVSAIDVAGNRSAESNPPVQATTPVAPPDLAAPTIPGNFTATATSSTSITLTWTASTDNVGVTRYEVSRDGVPLGFTTGAVVALVDAGRTPSTTYSYTVLAMDAAGNSSGIATTQGTTPAASSSSSGGGAKKGGGSFDGATLFAGLALLLWSRAQRRLRFKSTRTS